ncbi:MAG: hypothetical protein VB070_07995 [Clostridiaceae bacterium]|nr:hypothetical protein [Clostridiaceae bacterium]
MKRILYACLEQTIHFQLKDDVGHAEAVLMVQKELNDYKLQMDKNHTKYQLISEDIQADGSIILKIKKQYNTYKCGDYFK